MDERLGSGVAVFWSRVFARWKKAVGEGLGAAGHSFRILPGHFELLVSRATMRNFLRSR